MDEIALQLITLGGLLLVALMVEAFGRHTRLPRISLLVLLGFLLGPAVLDLINPQANASFSFIVVCALSMVGFLVGGKLSLEVLNRVGKAVLWISLCQIVVTAGIVGLGLILLGQPPVVGLLIAAIATATDPAATLEAIRESRRTDDFAKTLTGIVAIDDAWGLLLFSIVLITLQALQGGGLEASVLTDVLLHLFGSILLGLGLGLPMAALSGRVRKGEPTLLEALGMVLLTSGLAHYFDLSYLLACVTLGTVVVNTARHHTRPFHAVEEIEWPFLALLFLFSGAFLDMESIRHGGLFALAYLLLRIAGRLMGGWVSALPIWIDTRMAILMGPAMLAQGGLALALAFLSARSFPEHAHTLTTVVICAIFMFEFIGPICARWALQKPKRQATGEDSA